MVLICCILFFLLLFCSVPIFIALGVPCAMWFVDSGTSFVTFAQKFFNSCDSFAMLVAVSSVFSYMLARAGVVSAIGDFAQNSIASPALFMIFNILVCFIAGCFVDATATMLLLGPIMLPIATSMGINPLHFACVFVLSNIMGGMTPPVGTQLFVITAISKTPITKIVKPMLYFILVYVLALIIITLVPALATWIPSFA